MGAPPTHEVASSPEAESSPETATGASATSSSPSSPPTPDYQPPSSSTEDQEDQAGPSPTSTTDALQGYTKQSYRSRVSWAATKVSHFYEDTAEGYVLAPGIDLDGLAMALESVSSLPAPPPVSASWWYAQTTTLHRFASDAATEWRLENYTLASAKVSVIGTELNKLIRQVNNALNLNVALAVER